MPILSDRPAVVTRPTARAWEPNLYLQLSPHGREHWIPQPEAATVFASMREATRAALRLPGVSRAFSLPLHTELGISVTVH